MRSGKCFLSCVAVLVGGCLVPDPAPLATSAASVDENALLDSLPSYPSSPAFARLNPEPYSTALESGAPINVWVSRQALASYAAIVPEQAGSGHTVPEGTLIVREVLDDAGAVKTLTLMYKGPAGYNPDLGDWWFGVTDPDGAPQKTGLLTECFGCHLERADDDFLFGVPAAMR